jgi:hypothetical protein
LERMTEKASRFMRREPPSFTQAHGRECRRINN